MISSKLKKNVWLAIACFVFTLLPLGFSQTYDGKTTFLNAILLIVFISIGFKFIIDYHNSKFTNKIISKYQSVFVSTIFYSDEQKFRILVFFTPIIISFIVGMLLYRGIPISGDSIAQYDHAKLLLMGMLSVPTHQFPEFFPLYNVITTGERWYSQYQLGHLLPLALGHLLGIIWLINPIMCGISALLLYLIAYDNYGIRIARITGILTILCTQWWYMASEYLNHNTSLLGCMLFFLAWLRLLKDFKSKYSWLYSSVAGFGIGLSLITRPISTIAVALPFGLYGLYKIWCEPRRHWLLLLPAILITLAFIAWQLYFNLQTTGDYLVFGPEKLYGDQVQYGFGHVITTSEFGAFYKNSTHDLWRGIGYLSNSLIELNCTLFSWPFPSLLFVFFGWMVFKSSNVSNLMFFSFVLLGLAYIPYFFQDLVFGARYMYEVTGFLIVATAIGIVRMPAVLRVLGVRVKYSKIVRFMGVFLCSLFLLGDIIAVVNISSKAVTTYSEMSEFQLDAQFPDNSLVFAKKKYYKKFMIFMPPLDDNRVIYALDLGDNNQKLIDYYPNRTVFIESEAGLKKLDRRK